MDRLEWKQCVQFAIPMYAGAAAAFAAAWNLQERQPGRPPSMTFQSGALLVLCGAFLVAALVLTALAILRHPSRRIDRRLELLEEDPRLTQTEFSSNAYSKNPPEGFPDHCLLVKLRVKKRIRNVLTLECDVPIYRAIARYRAPRSATITQSNFFPKRNLGNRIVVTVGDGPLPSGAELVISLFSSSALSLRRVMVGEKV